MPRSLSILVSIFALVAACGGAGVAPGAIQPRYEAMTGSRIRYHIVLRTVPADREGRTVSTNANVAVRRARGDVFDTQVSYDDVHLSGDRGSLVEEPGVATLSFERDARLQMRGEPTIAGDTMEATPSLAQLFREGLVLPESAVGPGGTWEIPPVEREVHEGVTIAIPRTATLVEVVDGVASIEVQGSAGRDPIDVDGATIGVAGTITETYRLRVSDGLVIESESTSEVRLGAQAADGTELGHVAHRQRSSVERFVGRAPRPAPHDWRPDRPGSVCAARVDGMGRRFAQAPRGVDLDPMAFFEVRLPSRTDGQRIEEAGPLLLGIDEETFLGALQGTDITHGTLAYIVAPEAASDYVLAAWLSDVPRYVELRRVVRGHSDPPSPPLPEGITALAAQLRSERSMDPWTSALAPLIALCRDAREAYQMSMMAEPNERTAQLRDGVHRAFARCGCDATDINRLERVMDLRLGSPDLRWVSISRDPQEPPVYDDEEDE